jgi:hypothetical protein
MCPF